MMIRLYINNILAVSIFIIALICEIICVSAEKYLCPYQMWSSLGKGRNEEKLSFNFTALINAPYNYDRRIEKEQYKSDRRARVCEFAAYGGNEYTVMWRKDGFSEKEGWKYSVYENLPFNMRQLLTENPRVFDLTKQDDLKTSCSLAFSSKVFPYNNDGERHVKCAFVNLDETGTLQRLFIPKPIEFELMMHHEEITFGLERINKTLEQNIFYAKSDMATKTAFIRIAAALDNGDKNEISRCNPDKWYSILASDPKNYCFETTIKEGETQLIVWPEKAPEGVTGGYLVYKGFPFDFSEAYFRASVNTENLLKGMRAFRTIYAKEIREKCVCLKLGLVIVDASSPIKEKGSSFSGEFYTGIVYSIGESGTADLAK